MESRVSETELLNSELFPDYELEEDHGVYVTFHYGPAYSFIATRTAGSRQFRVSRTTISEDGSVVLTFICNVYTLPEARAVAQVHLKRLLETQELAHASGQ